MTSLRSSSCKKQTATQQLPIHCNLWTSIPLLISWLCFVNLSGPSSLTLIWHRFQGQLEEKSPCRFRWATCAHHWHLHVGILEKFDHFGTMLTMKLDETQLIIKFISSPHLLSTENPQLPTWLSPPRKKEPNRDPNGTNEIAWQYFCKDIFSIVFWYLKKRKHIIPDQQWYIILPKWSSPSKPTSWDSASSILNLPRVVPSAQAGP